VHLWIRTTLIGLQSTSYFGADVSGMTPVHYIFEAIQGLKLENLDLYRGIRSPSLLLKNSVDNARLRVLWPRFLSPSFRGPQWENSKMVEQTKQLRCPRHRCHLEISGDKIWSTS